MRRALLAVDDVGRVTAALGGLGVRVDRSMVGAIKQYNFNSPGIAMSHANYQAWQRLAQGKGQIRDAQYLVHEAAEVRELRAAAQRPGGVDFMGPGYESMSAAERARWTAKFDAEFMKAHSRALAAEYDFVAQQVAQMTNGRVRISRTVAAVAHSRAEHPSSCSSTASSSSSTATFPQWQARAGQTVEIGRGLQEHLRLGPTPTLRDLVHAIRHAPPRPG